MDMVTPVFKKGKDALLTTNYRDITVSSILGKLFELILLSHQSHVTLNNQYTQQFVITNNLSTNFASF